MPTIYRISPPGREPVVDVGSVEAIEGAIRAGGPGCFHIDEIAKETLPSGHTSRRWGPRSNDPTAGVRLTRTHDRGMLEDIPDDLMPRLGYRIAYGEAARLAEMARFDHGWGRDFAAQVGEEADAIEREVLRRVSHTIHPELIRLAVQDALEQRKPRW